MDGSTLIPLCSTKLATFSRTRRHSAEAADGSKSLGAVACVTNDLPPGSHMPGISVGKTHQAQQLSLRPWVSSSFRMRGIFFRCFSTSFSTAAIGSDHTRGWVKWDVLLVSDHPLPK